jgi:hypothetical protein
MSRLLISLLLSFDGIQDPMIAGTADVIVIEDSCSSDAATKPRFNTRSFIPSPRYHCASQHHSPRRSLLTFRFTVARAMSAVLIPMIPLVPLCSVLLIVLLQSPMRILYRNMQEVLQTFSHQYRWLSTGAKLQLQRMWTLWI